MKFIVFYYLILLSTSIFSQSGKIEGRVVLEKIGKPVSSINVSLENTFLKTKSNVKGEFVLTNIPKGEYILIISHNNYKAIHIPVSLMEIYHIELGDIIIKQDLIQDQMENLVELSINASGDIQENDFVPGLLSATRDVYVNRASFDFGQAFFRIRGYDSSENQVLLNGIPMNRQFNGRAEWNNWGGLNDISRHQEYSHGIQHNENSFGGIRGTTSISVRPSDYRRGLKATSSYSNRTYNQRIMLTYNGRAGSKFWYSLSGSRRWAKEGYIDGSLYDAYSLFGAVEFKFNEFNSLGLTGIFSSTKRGRSTALTEEVYKLTSNKYNSFWGYQNGDIRNTRERRIQEPIFFLNYNHLSDKLNLNIGIGNQFGERGNSRLAYFNAPNPNPSYYRYLPSFYINNNFGSGFNTVSMAKESFVSDSQIDWAQLYEVNINPMRQGEASYLLSEDIVQDSRWLVNALLGYKFTETLYINAGFFSETLESQNYAQIKDLLGASFHTDIDPFSETLNNTEAEIEKSEGEIHDYNYTFSSVKTEAFVQFKWEHKKWNVFAATAYYNLGSQRDGKFRNERFPQRSLGKSDKLNFSGIKLKAGIRYTLSGRHWFELNALQMKRAPSLQNSFINPRENNEIVPGLKQETVESFEGNYFLRFPNLKGRLSIYQTRILNSTDVNFFYIDSGVGSDFVQEVVTSLDQKHLGVELGLEYQISSSVKLSGVVSLGEYTYISDPDITINFDTASGTGEEPISPEGSINLGKSQITGLKLPRGPQHAYSLGVEYRDPDYWWIGINTNYLTKSFPGISLVNRTSSFYTDPETGEPFDNIDLEKSEKLLKQNPLDEMYYLNLIGGKSWIIDDTYIGLFVSINNLFNAVYRTGGYEQNRNGNYSQLLEDNTRENPSFGPKYWYGFGRTFFLNLSVSF